MTATHIRRLAAIVMAVFVLQPLTIAFCEFRCFTTTHPRLSSTPTAIQSACHDGVSENAAKSSTSVFRADPSRCRHDSSPTGPAIAAAQVGLHKTVLSATGAPWGESSAFGVRLPLRAPSGNYSETPPARSAPSFVLRV